MSRHGRRETNDTITHERHIMSANRYPAVLTNWQNNLIIARAKRMGLRGHEVLEAQQEIALHVAAFQHQPERSNGASEATALTAVIDRRLKMLRRAGARYQRRQQRAHLLRVRPSDHRQDLDRHLLAVDVRDAIAGLPPTEQLVCQLLGQGATIASIARTLCCSWHSAQRIIENIRTQFRGKGLDGWIIDR